MTLPLKSCSGQGQAGSGWILLLKRSISMVPARETQPSSSKVHVAELPVRAKSKRGASTVIRKKIRELQYCLFKLGLHRLLHVLDS